MESGKKIDFDTGYTVGKVDVCLHVICIRQTHQTLFTLQKTVTPILQF